MLFARDVGRVHSLKSSINAATFVCVCMCVCACARVCVCGRVVFVLHVCVADRENVWKTIESCQQH